MAQRYGEVMSLYTYGHSYENRSLIVTKVVHNATRSKNINFCFFLKPILYQQFFQCFIVNCIKIIIQNSNYN